MITKEEKIKLRVDIFKKITTEWEGAFMIFPMAEGGHIIINGGDIVKIIDKAIKKFYENNLENGDKKSGRPKRVAKKSKKN